MVDFNDIARKVLGVPTENSPDISPELSPRLRNVVTHAVASCDVYYADGAALEFARAVAEDVARQSGSQVLADALEGLLEAIPRQTNDADWWPDELTDAVFVAKTALEQFGDLK
jgi:hypothetical protein